MKAAGLAVLALLLGGCQRYTEGRGLFMQPIGDPPVPLGLWLVALVTILALVGAVVFFEKRRGPDD